VEAALEQGGADRVVGDWHERRRAELICQDLAEFGDLCAQPEPDRTLADQPELLGALYVLEGLRLGGALWQDGAAGGGQFDHRAGRRKTYCVGWTPRKC